MDKWEDAKDVAADRINWKKLMPCAFRTKGTNDDDDEWHIFLP